MRTEKVKADGVRHHPFNGEGATHVLQVCTCVLMGFLENGLACTMLVSVGLISKVVSPKMTWGPMAMLAADGAKKLEIIF
jgi:hypothetical protein